MDVTAHLLNRLEKKQILILRGLALTAAAREVDGSLFRELWNVVDRHLTPDEVDRVYSAVVRSRLVESTFSRTWRVHPQYKKPLEDYFRTTGNGDFAKCHSYLASRLEEERQPPSTDTIQGRLNFTRWLRHRLLSTTDSTSVISEAFEKAYDYWWVGDTRALLQVARATRPELAATDCQFLAMEGLQEYREGNRGKALSHFLHLRRKKELPRLRLIAIALHLLGLLRGKRNKHEEALEDLNESLEILRDLGDRYGQAQVLHTRGQLYGKRRRKRKEALKDLKESLEILRDLKDRYGQAQVLHTRGQLYGKWGELKKALDDLKESLEIGREINNRSHQAQVLHSRGQLYGKWGELKKALDDLKESLEIDKDLKDRYGQAQVLNTRGQLYGKSGELKKALDDLKESLEIGREINNRYHQAQVLHTRGQLYGKSGELKKALDDLKESLEIGREINNRYHQAQVLNTRAGFLLRHPKQVKQEKDSDSSFVAEIIDDLLLSLRLDNRPKTQSVVYLYLAQAFETTGDTALAAAALRRKIRTDKGRGSAGIRYLEKAEAKLRDLEDSLEEKQIVQAEARLADLRNQTDTKHLSDQF